jgi:type IV pilus assembly protein PilM
LDLGATSVRAAILTLGTTQGRPSVAMQGVGAVALPVGAVVNGVVNEPEIVTAALKQLWKLNDFGGRHVILGIANPQVVVRSLRIPNLTPQQRAKALPFQAREIIALPLNQVILDFAQIGEPDPETKMLNGLLIATPRQPVLAAVEAVERAGLTVARVDLSSFAALRSTAFENVLVEAVIDLGAHLTTIVIHNHGIPQLVRTVARGGQELTDLLADRLRLSSSDAESAKHASRLATAGDATSSALDEGIRPLLAEIRSSINYFRAGNDGAQLERISLTGGAAQLPGLADALATQNGVPTAMITPMQHVDSSAPGKRRSGADLDAAHVHRSASAVSVGLAMGAAA